MSNNSSKYKDDIIRLKQEGKTYLEIVDILKCSKSIVSYYSSNKQKEREYKRRREPSNKIRTFKNRKKGVLRNRIYVDEYLKNHPCVDCGNSDIRVLEFDHVRGIKDDHICKAVRNAWSLERLKKEIAKCEIRCCNCHRIVTINRRKNIN